MPKYTYPKEPTPEVLEDLMEHSTLGQSVSTTTGAWLAFGYAEYHTDGVREDKALIKRFMEIFDRPPQHVVTDGWWIFVGPVTSKEETERKWRGRNEK